MLRRFEIFSLADHAPAAEVERLLTAFRTCDRYIPEVRHSFVGRNRSDVPLHVVWEAAFDSAEAYQRYMVHPFHAEVLDRYLLKDGAERVVSDNRLGAGLVGYECDEPTFLAGGRFRRLLLLRPDGPTAPPVRANTMGPRWFDGVTPVTGRPAWTHLWEEGFESLADLHAHPVPAPDGPLLELVYEREAA